MVEYMCQNFELYLATAQCRTQIFNGYIWLYGTWRHIEKMNSEVKDLQNGEWIHGV